MDNNLLTESLEYTGNLKVETKMSFFRYSQTDLEVCEDFDVDNVEGSLLQDSVVWIHSEGLAAEEKIGRLCSAFGVDKLVIQDLLNVHHPSKVEERLGCNLVISKMFGDGELNHVVIIQGDGYVLTFSENPDLRLTDGVVKALDNNSFRIRSRKSDYLMTVFLNSVISNHLSCISEVDSDMEEMESELLEGASGKEIGVRIQALRKRYLAVKQVITPLREQFGKMLRTDSDLLCEANKPFFSDVNDHIMNVAQKVELCRETLASLTDLYISNNNTKMNDIMKQLTLVSTIFIPLTFLAGIWGMNFTNMPELSWEWGYPLAWGLMLVIGIVVFIILKVKKWG